MRPVEARCMPPESQRGDHRGLSGAAGADPGLQLRCAQDPERVAGPLAQRQEPLGGSQSFFQQSKPPALVGEEEKGCFLSRGIPAPEGPQARSQAPRGQDGPAHLFSSQALP